ncbi:hypothetical protein ES703_70556 [subsurface metagenome]
MNTPGGESAPDQLQLTPEACKQGDAYQGQGAYCEKRARQRKPPPNALHFLPVQGAAFINKKIRGQEQERLSQGMTQDQKQNAFQGGKIGSADSQGNHPHLAHGRIGQHLLKILFPNGCRLSDQNGGRPYYQKEYPQALVCSSESGFIIHHC